MFEKQTVVAFGEDSILSKSESDELTPAELEAWVDRWVEMRKAKQRAQQPTNRNERDARSVIAAVEQASREGRAGFGRVPSGPSFGPP